SRLALVETPRRAGQHHHHCAAAKMPRTQPCRKRLAIHARQLALKSRLQILRRSRRALLRGLEQARRSALAHHVHRIASMGARVLINGTWYYYTSYYYYYYYYYYYCCHRSRWPLKARAGVFSPKANLIGSVRSLRWSGQHGCTAVMPTTDPNRT